MVTEERKIGGGTETWIIFPFGHLDSYERERLTALHVATVVWQLVARWLTGAQLVLCVVDFAFRS